MAEYNKDFYVLLKLHKKNYLNSHTKEFLNLSLIFFILHYNTEKNLSFCLTNVSLMIILILTALLE